MCKNPKHSPPDSPLLNRKITTQSSANFSAESLYATQVLLPSPSPTTTHNVNGNVAIHTNISLSSVGGMEECSSSKGSSKAINVVNNKNPGLVNKNLSKVISTEESIKESKAPPLPPRKASPGVGKSSTTTSMLNLFNNQSNNNSNTGSDTLSRSTENIGALCNLDSPKAMAPPIPKHNTPNIRPNVEALAQELSSTVIQSPVNHESHHLVDDHENDTIVVGPAQTITGVIDTRPLDARKPISDLQSSNLYHLKNSGGMSSSTHIRHQSLPSNTSTTIGRPVSCVALPEESSTPPIVPEHQTHIDVSVSEVSLLLQSQVNNMKQSSASVQPQRPTSTPPTTQSTYENMNVQNSNGLSSLTKDCEGVPYENINLDYIARLMNEGYSKEHVITALGISRNNIEMAYDMLSVFVRKCGDSG